MSKTMITKETGSYYNACPRPLAVVTVHAHHKQVDNAMTAAWPCPISVKPPLYGVALSLDRYSFDLINESKEFGINFFPLEKAELVAGIGGTKGKEVEKFQKFGLTKEKDTGSEVPILEQAYAAYQCRFVESRVYGDHHWVVGEITAVFLQPEAFGGGRTMDLSKVNPIVYLGDENYTIPDVKKLRHVDRKVYSK